MAAHRGLERGIPDPPKRQLGRCLGMLRKRRPESTPLAKPGFPFLIVRSATEPDKAYALRLNWMIGCLSVFAVQACP
jgi:hypothetical protein